MLQNSNGRWKAPRTGSLERLPYGGKRLDRLGSLIMVFDIGCRIFPISMKAANREILLSFWKVHILHHADEEPIHGQWILTELRRHGYDLSPGTLYPLLNRMERLGWLKCKADPEGGRRARKDYRLTREGRKVLGIIKHQLSELYEEVVLEGVQKRS
jgi:PadR family transcriptional regulator PadR